MMAYSTVRSVFIVLLDLQFRGLVGVVNKKSRSFLLSITGFNGCYWYHLSPWHKPLFVFPPAEADIEQRSVFCQPPIGVPIHWLDTNMDTTADTKRGVCDASNDSLAGEKRGKSSLLGWYGSPFTPEAEVQLSLGLPTVVVGRRRKDARLCFTAP